MIRRAAMGQVKKTSFWKMFRVAILMIVLLTVLMNAWRDKNQDWSQPIFITLYPINADQSRISQAYIDKLSDDDFQSIADYLKHQAREYTPRPIYFNFKLGQQIQKLPPIVPAEGSILEIALWSLKFRYYAWQQSQNMGYTPSVELFLNYYDPQTQPVLKHSTALQNGRIGIVNLFSNVKQSEQNKIVITHELLHAFGATDKYDMGTGNPIFPLGYADPQQQPLYPQKKAEIMAVAIPLTAHKSKMADQLSASLVSALTAQEVGWTD